MKYGTFDDRTREYVITNPRTPTKWINYVGSLAFGGFVDHTGGALICKGDPALNRITKYIPQLPSSAFKGTTASSPPTLSPLWMPTTATNAAWGWDIPASSPSSTESAAT
jgi:hypothetical protein